MIEQDIPKIYLDILKEIEKYISKIASKDVIINNNQLSTISSNYSISDELLFKLINSSGKWHSGDPVYLKMKEIGGGGALIKDDNNYVLSCLDLLKKLGMILMCRRNSLSALYEPGGYIGWHHNGNIPGRNIIFSWSETGDGVFKLYNDKLEKMEVYNDSPGWSVKSLKFYSHLEAEKKGYSWHAMNTNCLRFTIAFLLTDQMYNYQDQIPEVIKYDLGLANKSLNGAYF
jgi:hypothetical protein